MMLDLGTFERLVRYPCLHSIAYKPECQVQKLIITNLFTDYLERHAKPHKRSWPGDEKQFARYLIPWKHRKLSTIQKRDIQALHNTIGKAHGRYAANRLLALLHVMFTKAMEWEWMDKANPAHGIRRFREQSRERFLDADELPRFFLAVSEEPNETLRDYILLSLLTGARRGNVQSMRWDDISLERGVWVIPVTKNGTTLTVPLVKEALAILTRRKLQAVSEWVFPSHGRSGHLMEPKRGWTRILERANITNLRLHDLRRTLGSWQASTGASLTVIGKSLGHKNVNTTAIYSRLNLDPVRQAVETATTAMLKAGQVFPGNLKKCRCRKTRLTCSIVSSASLVPS